MIMVDKRYIPDTSNIDAFLKKYIVGDDTELTEKMNSAQYPLSNTIMELETRCGFNQKETATYLGIDYDKLLRLESVDLSIPVKEYEDAVNKLTNYYIKGE